MYQRFVPCCVTLVLALHGCSDGSDDWSALEPDSPAAGIYTPSTFKPSGEAVIIGNTAAVISPSGELYLFANDGPWFDEVIPLSIPYQVSGPIEIEGDKFVAPSLRVYPDGQLDSAPLVAEGVFVQDDYISADYTWGDTQGQFHLRHSELNSETPGLGKLEGLWGIVIGFVSPDGSSFDNLMVTLTVYADGTAFGSDSTGCTYSGIFSLVGPQYNFYNLDLELSSCGARDGEYSGPAFVRPCCGPDPSGQALVFSTSNPDRSFNAGLFGPNFST